MQEMDVSSENTEPPDWMPDLAHVARWVCGELGRDSWSLGVLLCDEQRMRGLNSEYRRVDEPTDVLTFVRDDERPAQGDPVEGDLAICVPYVAASAASVGVPPREEFLRVFVHGLLHLAGYTHEGVDLSSPGALDDPMLGLQERLVGAIARGLDS